MQLADEVRGRDIIIDGGNSYYPGRHRPGLPRLAREEIHYVDVGTRQVGRVRARIAASAS